jgi:hypothetical protein
MRALVVVVGMARLLAVGVERSTGSSTTSGGTILYILDPDERAQLFTVSTSAPFSRRNLGISNVADAAYAHDGDAIHVLRRPPGSQTVELTRMRLNGRANSSCVPASRTRPPSPSLQTASELSCSHRRARF